MACHNFQGIFGPQNWGVQDPRLSLLSGGLSRRNTRSGGMSPNFIQQCWYQDWNPNPIPSIPSVQVFRYTAAEGIGFKIKDKYRMLEKHSSKTSMFGFHMFCSLHLGTCLEKYILPKERPLSSVVQPGTAIKSVAIWTLKSKPFGSAMSSYERERNSCFFFSNKSCFFLFFSGHLRRWVHKKRPWAQKIHPPKHLFFVEINPQKNTWF